MQKVARIFQAMSRWCLGCKKGRCPIKLISFINFFGLKVFQFHHVFKGAMSPVAHALTSENKLEKDSGPSFSSSVGDFGRLFLAVEISAIVL